MSLMPNAAWGCIRGSPLSPLLCNLYLDAFDRTMLAAGYRAIRYSDIAIPVPDRGSAELAVAASADALGGLRLTLDAAKSQVISFDSGVPFLGSTVTSLTSPGAMALSHLDADRRVCGPPGEPDPQSG